MSALAGPILGPARLKAKSDPESITIQRFFRFSTGCSIDKGCSHAESLHDDWPRPARPSSFVEEGL